MSKVDILELYLDYVNNYLTIEAFARDNELTMVEAHNVINKGRKLLKNK